MFVYQEFVRGSHFYQNVIIMNDEYKRLKLLSEDCFYPVTQGQADGDEPDLAEIRKLNKSTVKAYMNPHSEPVDIEMYVEGDWAYSITEV